MQRFMIVTVGTVVLGAILWLLIRPVLTELGSFSQPAEKPVVAAQPVWEPEPVGPDLSYEGFDPSHIISDDDFYNAEAMTEAQVEAFIAKWNKGCRPGFDGTPCLADYRVDSPSFPADRYCSGDFEGEVGDTAASVIHKAAVACGVNPQVLLTILQKEQSLITASGPRLNETRYTIAMGYACPDHSHCDSDFFGFPTQVYYAARQMSVYEQNPGSYMVLPYATTYIPYAPGEECEGSEVYVDNQATANLYNYTPYQPSPGALLGEGGPCTTMGNQNFYALFNAWFKS